MLPLRYAVCQTCGGEAQEQGWGGGRGPLSHCHLDGKRIAALKKIYPYFYYVPSSSESILKSVEPSFHLMSQQIILDSTQVFLSLFYQDFF